MPVPLNDDTPVQALHRHTKMPLLMKTGAPTRTSASACLKAEMPVSSNVGTSMGSGALACWNTKMLVPWNAGRPICSSAVDIPEHQNAGIIRYWYIEMRWCMGMPESLNTGTVECCYINVQWCIGMLECQYDSNFEL